MATINAVTAGHGTLVSGAVDTINLTARSHGTGLVKNVTVYNETAVGGTGPATIYATNDGTTPTSGGSNTFAILPGTSKTIPFFGTVKLIATGTPVYSVEAVQGS